MSTHIIPSVICCQGNLHAHMRERTHTHTEKNWQKSFKKLCIGCKLRRPPINICVYSDRCVGCSNNNNSSMCVPIFGTSNHHLQKQHSILYDKWICWNCCVGLRVVLLLDRLIENWCASTLKFDRQKMMALIKHRRVQCLKNKNSKNHPTVGCSAKFRLYRIHNGCISKTKIHLYHSSQSHHHFRIAGVLYFALSHSAPIHISYTIQWRE